MLVVTSPWQPHAATYSVSLLLHVCLLGDEGGNTHTHTHVYTDTHTHVQALIGPHTCEHPDHTCTQECIYPHMHTQVHARVDTEDHIHAHIHVCVNTERGTCACTHDHTCANVNTHTPTCAHTGTHRLLRVERGRALGWMNPGPLTACCAASSRPHYSCDGPSASPAFVRRKPTRPGECVL